MSDEGSLERWRVEAGAGTDANPGAKPARDLRAIAVLPAGGHERCTYCSHSEI